ncbi:MAG: hypothetical protein JEZ08_19025 [Clostridiales bacterium]|nr:hypothetical protein [Clostridiales bacterium]
MNKRGSTLVMAILLVAVMSIFALALFTITVTDKKIVVQQDDNIQSYYLARTGADTVAYYIMNHPDRLSLLSDKESAAVDYGNGSYVVEVDEVVAGKDIVLTSIGTVEGQETTMQLSLTRITMDHAIFTEDALDVHNMGFVEGKLGSNLTVRDYDNQGDLIAGRNPDETDEYMNLTIPSPIFPSLPPGDDVTVITDYTYDLGSARIDIMDLSNPSGPIVFDTGGSDLELVVRHFDLKADIEIINGGRLILYIEEFASIKNPSASTNSPDDFIIYLEKDAFLTIDTPFGANCRIIGPEATVAMASNSSVLGSIIAGSFSGTSNSEIRYSVPADGELVLGFRIVEWK